MCYHLIAPSALKAVANGACLIALLAFFMFSGYFYTPGKRPFGENIKARAKSLLVPFLKYSLCFWVIGTIYLLVTKGATFVEALLCLRYFYGGCIWNRTLQNWFGWEYHSLGKRYMFLADFWFLLMLFFSSALFFATADRVKHSRAKQGLAIALLLAVSGVLRGFGISLPYNILLVPFWTAVMLSGYVLKDWRLLEPDFMNGGIGWVAGIAAVVAAIGANTFLGYGTNLFRGTFDAVEPVSMLVIFALGLVGSWGLACLCIKIERAGARVKELAWVGSHSLTLYLYHMLYYWLLCILTGYPMFYDPKTASGAMLIKSLLMILAVTGLGVLTAIVSDRMKQRAQS